MANIFKCDRCKNIQGDRVQPSGSVSIVSRNEDTDNGNHMDLCSSCWDNLKRWAGGYNNAKPIDAEYKS